MKSLQIPFLWGGAIFAFAAFVLIIEALGRFNVVTQVQKDVVPKIVDPRGSKLRGFELGGVYLSVPSTPANVRAYGSWISEKVNPDGDANVGEFVSPWYRAQPIVNVFVSGYPTGPLMRLEIETETAAGRRGARPITTTDPHETWALKTVDIPSNATKFRLHAVDNNRGLRGWLGVSEPFLYEDVAPVPHLDIPGVKSLYAAATLASLVGIACMCVAWMREGSWA